MATPAQADSAKADSAAVNAHVPDLAATPANDHVQHLAAGQLGCDACGVKKPGYLFFRETIKYAPTRKCFVCRRVEAVKDFVKNRKSVEKEPTLPEQLNHLDLQQHSCLKYRKTLKNHGIDVPVKYLEQAMDEVMKCAELKDAVSKNPSANIFKGAEANDLDVLFNSRAVDPTPGNPPDVTGNLAADVNVTANGAAVEPTHGNCSEVTANCATVEPSFENADDVNANGAVVEQPHENASEFTASRATVEPASPPPFDSMLGCFPAQNASTTPSESASAITGTSEHANPREHRINHGRAVYSGRNYVHPSIGQPATFRKRPRYLYDAPCSASNFASAFASGSTSGFAPGSAPLGRNNFAEQAGSQPYNRRSAPYETYNSTARPLVPPRSAPLPSTGLEGEPSGIRFNSPAASVNNDSTSAGQREATPNLASLPSPSARTEGSYHHGRSRLETVASASSQSVSDARFSSNYQRRSAPDHAANYPNRHSHHVHSRPIYYREPPEIVDIRRNLAMNSHWFFHAVRAIELSANFREAEMPHIWHGLSSAIRRNEPHDFETMRAWAREVVSYVVGLPGFESVDTRDREMLLSFLDGPARLR